MLDETEIQLKNLNSQMTVSFILLSTQQNVYDEFVKYLNTIQTFPSTTSKTSSTSKTNDQLKIPYDEKSKIYVFFFKYKILYFSFL